MSKDIVIFEDGKFFRGSRAKLIKRGNKRVLIEFGKYDYELEEDFLVQEWFKLFIPSYVRDKKPHKYNNKHNQVRYRHPETNKFYSDYCQTEEYKLEMKDNCSEEYWNKLWGD